MTSPTNATQLALTPFPADFLCIGAQKACTSWLNLALKSDLNKNIFIPYIKETFYLNLVEGPNECYPPPEGSIVEYAYSSFRQLTESHIQQAAAELWGEDGMTQAQLDHISYLCKSLTYYWTGLGADWYQHLFSVSEPDQLRGELTPDYSFLGNDLIASLHKAKPSLKILLITRDPISRDLSQLKMQLLARHPNPTDEQCIDFLSQPHVRNRSEFWNIYQRWTNAFGGAAVMTIDSKDIETNPRLVINRISHFLNVDLQIPETILKARDNISRSAWEPSKKVWAFLSDYYKSHDVYGDLMAN